MPNTMEILGYAHIDKYYFSNERNMLEHASIMLSNDLCGANIIVTRSEKGMLVYDAKSHSFHDIPSNVVEIADVTGAGDTATAVVCLSLCGGADLRTAAYMANIASGIAVTKRGVTKVNFYELKETLYKEGYY